MGLWEVLGEGVCLRSPWVAPLWSLGGPWVYVLVLTFRILASGNGLWHVGGWMEFDYVSLEKRRLIVCARAHVAPPPWDPFGVV